MGTGGLGEIQVILETTKEEIYNYRCTFMKAFVKCV